MQVCLIQVPYVIGDDRHGGSKGAQRLVQSADDALFAAKGAAVIVERVERGKPFTDSASSLLAVNKQLGATVRKAVAAGQLPLVVAGSCDVCMGVLAAFDHARCGVVWVDAHGDFNTPESTVSGFFAGMSLAVITGHCYRNFWGQIGDNAPISEAATLMLGVRDLSPAEERERLERSAIRVVSWHQGKPQADVLASIDELASRVQEVYLHVDLDGLDPKVAPGIVDEPVPGGLSLREIEEAISAVADRFRVRAAALTTYNPDRDQDETTLHAGLRIIELLVQYASEAEQAVSSRSLMRRGADDAPR